MPRPPKFNSGKSLTIHASTPSQEEKLRAFKEIHARNPELEIQKTVMECVDRFLAKHNWPPGNSQTLLEVYGEKTKKKCFFCEGQFPSLHKVKYISGLVAGTCPECLELQKEKTTVKKVLGVL